jgi:pimeloyl-ACP methyl ester carboxylesterase
MPHITARDGVSLYYEEAGEGTPVVFVHEYAGDWRSWEAQMRHFARAHRCVTYSQRGYPPSDVPQHGARYSQDIFREDVINYPQRCISVVTAGCGWGSTPDAKQREAMKALAAETGKMFAEEPIATAAAKYADAPMRHAQKHKDPRGHAEFTRMLAEHSSEGHAQTMFNLQLKRPTLWEMEDSLRRFAVPLLVIVGDEDAPCIDGSVFLKRIVPTAGLLVIPRSGHNVPAEEPTQFNAALAELIASSEAGRWLAHKPSA